jgi:hypothetical protein
VASRLLCQLRGRGSRNKKDAPKAAYLTRSGISSLAVEAFRTSVFVAVPYLIYGKLRNHIIENVTVLDRNKISDPILRPIQWLFVLNSGADMRRRTGRPNGRPPIYEKAMTPAQRQQRSRFMRGFFAGLEKKWAGRGATGSPAARTAP